MGGAADAVPGRHRPPHLIDSGAVGEAGELTRDELLDALVSDAEKAYATREAQLEEIAGEGAMRQLERNVLLNVIDRKWREHLYEMDYLKEGIGLRAMAQRDPLVEYQREGYDMFTGMLDGLKEESVGFLFNVQVEAAPSRPVDRSPRWRHRRAWPNSRLPPRRTPQASRRRPARPVSGRLRGATLRVTPRRRACAPKELRTRRPRSPTPVRPRTAARRCSATAADSARRRRLRRAVKAGGNGVRRPGGRPRPARTSVRFEAARRSGRHQPMCRATTCHDAPCGVLTRSTRQATACSRGPRV